jgi:hypothetical protein
MVLVCCLIILSVSAYSSLVLWQGLLLSQEPALLLPNYQVIATNTISECQVVCVLSAPQMKIVTWSVLFIYLATSGPYSGEYVAGCASGRCVYLRKLPLKGHGPGMAILY